ncbi:sigma-70 family RNA polymerase sigma factor [Streptomyces flavidovirens]|uniref:RNA polymerase sigma factor n=1 Tax=Streptomyces flavidovirens TaxID=67298 RepID=UPI00343B3753
MGTDGDAVRAVAWDGAPSERWQRVWGHREHLLKVARRRSMSAEDAEDAVHEAMVRAAERANVDNERLGAWLTTVTVRLCIDRLRQVTREAEVHTRAVLGAPGLPHVEEAVCDRAEAKWLANRSTDLPERQQEVLSLRAQGLAVADIAQQTGLSYQAARSLLARARKTLHTVLAGTLATGIWAWRSRPWTVVGSGQTATVASAAAILAVAVLGLSTLVQAEAPKAPDVLPYEAPLRAGANAPFTGSSVEHSPPMPLTDHGGGGVALTGAGHERSSAPTLVPMNRSDTSPAPTLPKAPQPTHPAMPEPTLPTLPAAPQPTLPTLPGAPQPTLPTLPEASALLAHDTPAAPQEPLRVDAVSAVSADVPPTSPLQ